LPEALTASDPQHAETRPTPSADDLREGAELARPIEDEKLRNLVARAASATLARARGDRSF